MQRLFLFFYQYRAFIFFVLIELLVCLADYKKQPVPECGFLQLNQQICCQNDGCHNAVFEYVNLKEVNGDLAQENAKLNDLNARLLQQGGSFSPKGYGLTRWLPSVIGLR